MRCSSVILSVQPAALNLHACGCGIATFAIQTAIRPAHTTSVVIIHAHVAVRQLLNIAPGPVLITVCALHATGRPGLF